MNVKIESLNKVLVILICLFYILSSVINTYIPSILKLVQVITLVFTFLLIPLLLRKNEKVYLFILFYAFLFLLLVPYFYSGAYFNSLISLSFILNVFMGFILWKEFDYSYSLLRIIFIINCIALVLETFFQTRFVLVSEDYDKSTISYLYKMGIWWKKQIAINRYLPNKKSSNLLETRGFFVWKVRCVRYFNLQFYKIS